MSDFVELALPRHTTDGVNYYVFSEPEELGMALRNDDGEIDHCNDEYIYYLFETEAQAHLAASMYYEDHGLKYPYEKEFEYVLLHNTPQKEWGRLAYRERQSRVMEFI